MSMTEKTYIVAGHPFKIILPENLTGFWQTLPSYAPFEVRISEPECEPIFCLEVRQTENSDTGDVLEGVYNDFPPYTWVYKTAEDHMTFGFSQTKQRPDALLKTDSICRTASLLIPSGIPDNEFRFAIDNAAMTMFALSTADKDTLLIHASVVECEGKAYAFTARSGTGKSTHSSLWLKHISGTNLLNDDNPVITLRDGQALICGSPWSGKTACYINRTLPLGAMIKLSQAPYNRISRLSILQAYAAFRPACSCLSWDRHFADAVNRTIEQFLQRCGVYHLECLPDRDAAVLCARTVMNS